MEQNGFGLFVIFGAVYYLIVFGVFSLLLGIILGPVKDDDSVSQSDIDNLWEDYQ